MHPSPQDIPEPPQWNPYQNSSSCCCRLTYPGTGKPLPPSLLQTELEWPDSGKGSARPHCEGEADLVWFGLVLLFFSARHQILTDQSFPSVAVLLRDNKAPQTSQESSWGCLIGSAWTGASFLKLKYNITLGGGGNKGGQVALMS